MLQFRSEDNMQNELLGKLIGLARATDGNEHLISASATAVIVESLAAILREDSASGMLEKLMERVTEEKRNMVPDCFRCASPCGKNNDYDMSKLWNADADIRSLKVEILNGIVPMANHALRGAGLGYHDEVVDRFFYKALIVVGMDDYTAEDLRLIVAEMEEVRLRCSAML